MSATIHVTGTHGEAIRHEILRHVTGSTVLVFDAPQVFYIIQVHDKLFDVMPIGEVLQPVRYGTAKKGRGGKIKKW